MRYEIFIGLRYLRARRKQTMISVITGISIFGVALGVAALIIVLSVMTGFENDLREKILGTNAHIVIVPFTGSDRMEDYREVLRKTRSIEGVRDAGAFIFSKVMISHRKRSNGIILKGVDPMSSGSADLKKYIVKGRLEDLAPADAAQAHGVQNIILGVELAGMLGVAVGGNVTLISSASIATPLGLMPRSRAFRVVGLFQSGMYEYDQNMAYISLEAAQSFLGIKNGVNGIEVRVRDIFKTRGVIDKLKETLGHRFWIRDWKEMNRSFFSALKLEKLAMFIILTLIVFVAAFNIIGSLIMMVMEKHKDIGILKAMGARNTDIRLIFLTEGIIIGSVGTLLGLVVGVTVSWVADTYHLIHLAGEVYYISYLPFKIQPLDVVFVCVASMLISFMATLYPARQAAKLDPVEAIRYE